MASLHDVMVYLVSKYPHPGDLANARLTKMIYLADWRAAIQHNRQITELVWEFNHYGPYLHDVIDEAKRSDDFQITDTLNVFGSRKQLISVKPEAAARVQLSQWETDALDHVLQQTARLSWANFIELVYSTYPIVATDRYSQLNLVVLASAYKNLKTSLPGKN